jgi:Asp-tRNA(Asn)/Glu-tRNA(Gln) amidotransferase A subunit family amidase
VIPIAHSDDEAPGSYTSATSLPRAPPNDGRPRFYTIADFHDAYKSGAVTPTDIVDALLPLIRRDIAQRGPHSTAFTESKVELVRQAAETSTKRWKAGKPLGILDGVPFAVKDDLDVTGYKRHCGTSHDYTEGRPVETSWCVRKVEEEGAVLIGKLNMHELGSGESNPIQLRLLGHHISLVHESSRLQTQRTTTPSGALH